ncbi:hypothetical protein KSP40_PGU010649 [Platanthera guangdongensis]|uniref:Gag-pol polyprotein n=1 Tax=Platanthera guangdongensis TaxID=2320717 RepID=A0ABR2LL65_9ASPA
MPDHEDPFCDALVIKDTIENFTVSRILVDNGSSVNVVFKKAFDAMHVEAKRVLASDGPLFGFSGERKEVEGGVGLHVTRGGSPETASCHCGRPQQLQRNIREAPDQHLPLRPLIFPSVLKVNAEGVQVRVRGDPKVAWECYVTAVNTISWQEGAEEMGGGWRKSSRKQEGRSWE